MFGQFAGSGRQGRRLPFDAFDHAIEGRGIGRGRWLGRGDRRLPRGKYLQAGAALHKRCAQTRPQGGRAQGLFFGVEGLQLAARGFGLRAMGAVFGRRWAFDGLGERALQAGATAHELADGEIEGGVTAHMGNQENLAAIGEAQAGQARALGQADGESGIVDGDRGLHGGEMARLGKVEGDARGIEGDGLETEARRGGGRDAGREGIAVGRAGEQDLARGGARVGLVLHGSGEGALEGGEREVGGVDDAGLIGARRDLVEAGVARVDAVKFGARFLEHPVRIGALDDDGAIVAASHDGKGRVDHLLIEHVVALNGDLHLPLIAPIFGIAHRSGQARRRQMQDAARAELGDGDQENAEQGEDGQDAEFGQAAGAHAVLFVAGEDPARAVRPGQGHAAFGGGVGEQMREVADEERGPQH